MEEKLCQISEEETVSNYNYEEFVRTISKDDKFSTKPNETEIPDNKFYQKEFLINNIQSNDVNSISLSQTENTSQTSENIFSNTNIISESPKESKFNENELNYYFGIENYFRKIYPEKFDEYKSSRNFLPKKSKDININKFQNNLSQSNLEENKTNNNNTNNFQNGNNLYYYPVNGNIIYYIYNNYYFNFLNIQSQSANKKGTNPTDSNTEKNSNQKEKDKKEFEKENFNKIKNNENIMPEKIEDEYQNIYIIKRKNKQNNSNNKSNKGNFYKSSKQERPKEKRYKDKEYKNCNYQNYNNNKNSYYYNNDNFNKFNGNYEKRKKRFYGENNYYKNKYHKETYY